MRISVNILDLSMKSREIEVSCIVIHEKEENTLNRVIYSKIHQYGSKKHEIKKNKSSGIHIYVYPLETYRRKYRKMSLIIQYPSESSGKTVVISSGIHIYVYPLETYRRKYRKMSLSHPKIEVSCIVIHEKEENTLNRVIYSNSIINTPIIVKMG